MKQGKFHNKVLLRYPEQVMEPGECIPYQNAIILVFSDTANVTMGVIMNYPYNEELSNEILRIIEWKENGIVHHGGNNRCNGTEYVKVFHSGEYSSKDTVMINENLGLTSSNAFINDPKKGKPEKCAMVYGYHAWLPGRLERELEQGIWQLADYDDSMFFSHLPVEKSWENAWRTHFGSEADKVIDGAMKVAEKRVMEKSA